MLRCREPGGKSGNLTVMMMRKISNSRIRPFVSLLFLLAAFSANAAALKPVEVPEVSNFKAESSWMRHKQVPMLLLVSASYCGYCEIVKEHWLKPMLRSGDYDDRVLIRKIELDSYKTLVDFDGSTIGVKEFAFREGAPLTPTVLFLGPDGDQVAEPILGVPDAEEYFGAYLESSIEEGLRCVRQGECKDY